ncbi:MarR family transcriptional regulator [Pseudoroseicyclus sp. CXY001]|uniref:MarR family transcriptional regulator n=1 Tax=Pseudoroseicyclus sp. CXY001 TaxID=3242492 RepID=UPI003570C96C
MLRPKSAIAAVLTGDIVGSTKLSFAALGAALEALAAVALREGAPFDRHRGDGWQIHLARPRRALRLALRLSAISALPSRPATRIAIGIGQASLPAEGDIAAGSGPAFETSGRLLDRMPAGDRLAIAGPGVNALHEALLATCGEIAGRWTVGQAEAIATALDLLGSPDDPPRHEDIAERLGITRQATQARLAGAGWNVLLRAIAAWEEEAP